MQPGRPRLYQSPEEMETEIEQYFIYIDGEEWTEQEIQEKPGRSETMKRYPENPTITGLILFLGFSHREAMHDYEKRDGFSDIIKKARLRVENGYEKSLNSSKNPVGSIFALKNMGWKDKNELEMSGHLNTTQLDLSQLSDRSLQELRAAQTNDTNRG